MPVGHAVFWLMLAAVAAPLLSRVPLGFKVPVVVLEVLLGIVIGPHVLGLVELRGILEAMFTLGMAATLFMAGIELDFSAMKGHPLSLALERLGRFAAGGPGRDRPSPHCSGRTGANDGDARGVHNRARHADPDPWRYRATRHSVRAPAPPGRHGRRIGSRGRDGAAAVAGIQHMAGVRIPAGLPRHRGHCNRGRDRCEAPASARHPSG